MLKEFIDCISERAVKAAGPFVTPVAAEPEHVYLLNGVRQIAEPRPRDHKAMSLQTIVAFAMRDVDSHDGNPPATWYSRSGVVLLLSDTTRRDRVTLALDYSPQLKRLQALEAQPKPFGQRELIFMLRTTFAHCLAPAGNILDVLRCVKWRSKAAADATVQHGKTSIGKTLEQELTGTGALPEYLTLDVPIFASGFPALRGNVELALEPDAATETFQLLPLPGSIETAIADAEARIGAELRAALGEGAAIYYGMV